VRARRADLVVHGLADRDPVEEAREWVQALPDARLLELPAVGAFPWIEARPVLPGGEPLPRRRADLIRQPVRATRWVPAVAPDPSRRRPGPGCRSPRRRR
jgi:hypothetical protein